MKIMPLLAPHETWIVYEHYNRDDHVSKDLRGISCRGVVIAHMLILAYAPSPCVLYLEAAKLAPG